MFQGRGWVVVFKENQSVFRRDSGCCLGWNRSRFHRNSGYCFQIGSVHVSKERASCCFQRESICVYEGFRLLFGVESVQVLEGIQATIWKGISSCLGRIQVAVWEGISPGFRADSSCY